MPNRSQHRTIPLWLSVVLTVVVATGAVSLYATLAQRAPAVVGAPPSSGAPSGAPQASSSVPPSVLPSVLPSVAPAAAPAAPTGVADPEPPNAEVDARLNAAHAGPNTAAPTANACIDDDTAQERFEDAVTRMRDRDATGGCWVLDTITRDALRESMWRAKAQNLIERRCSDDGRDRPKHAGCSLEPPVVDASAAAASPAEARATRRSLERRMRALTERGCGGDVVRAFADTSLDDAEAVAALTARITAAEARCTR